MITKRVNMNRIKILDCKQVRSDLPIFEGRCSDNGDVIQVIESGFTIESIRISHNMGLKKGLAIGAVAALVGLATAWTMGKMISPNQKDKED